jgi:hypothetical protein
MKPMLKKCLFLWNSARLAKKKLFLNVVVTYRQDNANKKFEAPWKRKCFEV